MLGQSYFVNLNFNIRVYMPSVGLGITVFRFPIAKENLFPTGGISLELLLQFIGLFLFLQNKFQDISQPLDCGRCRIREYLCHLGRIYSINQL